MNTELCEFVMLILDRMDTNPEEFMQRAPNFRWATLVNGIVDTAMGDTESSGARSLWALEPHELEAITTKYKAIYLEQQKREFLKNILSGNEAQGKKLDIIKKRATPLTSADITRHALQIMEDEWAKSWSNNALGQNQLLVNQNAASGLISGGYTDARAQYANERPAKVVRKQSDDTNNN
jgi:hypothetical protein